MIGKTISRYTVRSKLGEGGMGEVYCADDPELGRQVALKVLPRALADHPERLERFRREARAVAALNHPNIVTLFNVEEAEGRRILVMELVEGKSLDQLIPAQGLSLSQVFDIAIPMADALSAAHESGITHRDLKPANVMVGDDGQVKVLDFGLAKLAEEAGPGAPQETELETATPGLTGEGTVMGTAPYMSPEQLQGKAVDSRSDVFSLGIVLYEMTTGRRPFQGESGIDLASSILKDAPSAVTDLRTDLPRHLGRIIQHCLEKDPERRFQSIKDVRNELQGLKEELASGALVSGSQPAVPAATEAGAATSPNAGFAPAPESSASGSNAPVSGATPAAAGSGRRTWMVVAVGIVVALAAWYFGRSSTPAAESTTGSGPAAPATTGTGASVAVLPFDNLSDDPEQEYFSDGLTDEIMTVLARVPDLRVAGRTSSFAFKGANEELETIGERLGVDHLLEGSVRKSGDRIRVTAQLVKATDGFQLWSESFDRDLADVFAVQDEIAQAVASALEVTLLSGTAVPESRPDIEAYNLVLRARYQLGRLTRADLARARETLQQALESDPDYAPIWAEMGLVHLRTKDLATADNVRRRAMDDARAALERALELDPDLATAHSRLGNVFYQNDLDFRAALASHERALALEPHNPVVVGNAATLFASIGRLDQSIELYEKQIAVDPLSLVAYFNLANQYLASGRPQRAQASLEQLLDLNPDFAYAYGLLGDTYLLQGRFAEAEVAYERFDGAVGDEPNRLHRKAMLAFSTGDQRVARQTLEDYEALYCEQNRTSCAQLRAWRGEPDEAFAWLDKAYAARESWLSGVLSDPFLISLHGDPRWSAFLDRMGLPID